jgi:mono/diheme cytochrome c family protein
MTRRVWRASAVTVLALMMSAACRSGPRQQPGDPMLDAIRAEERKGDLSYVESQGKHLFVHYCATCHGDEGKGDGQNASNLSPPPPDLTVSKDSRDATFIRKVIAEGSAAVGRSPLSPPWGRSLSRQQIDYLVAYCQSIGRKKR